MKGFKLFYGIWNRNHDLMSRDTAMPSVHSSKALARRYLRMREQRLNIKYEIWFSNIDELDVWECQCGHVAEKGTSCWYCDKKESE